MPTDPYAPLDEGAMEMLARFCTIDRWSASLQEATLTLGHAACRHHGLDPENPRIGLLDFVRCYDAKARHAIIGLFEAAAARSGPFHYAAELKASEEGAGKRLVHCFGDRRASADPAAGDELFGVFLFSRDRFETPAED